jgi:hypothetical protein
MDEHSPDPTESRVSQDSLLDSENAVHVDDELDIEDVGLESKSSWYLFLLTLSIGG